MNSMFFFNIPKYFLGNILNFLIDQLNKSSFPQFFLWYSKFYRILFDATLQTRSTSLIVERIVSISILVQIFN